MWVSACLALCLSRDTSGARKREDVLVVEVVLRFAEEVHRARITTEISVRELQNLHRPLEGKQKAGEVSNPGE